MEHYPEKCESIFVSWKWAITAIISLIATVAVLAWSGSARLTKVDISQELLSQDMSRQQLAIEKLQLIRYDIDTVKILLRQKKGR